jgi:hypothetical protein
LLTIEVINSLADGDPGNVVVQALRRVFEEPETIAFDEFILCASTEEAPTRRSRRNNALLNEVCGAPVAGEIHACPCDALAELAADATVETTETCFTKPGAGIGIPGLAEAVVAAFAGIPLVYGVYSAWDTSDGWKRGSTRVGGALWGAQV